MILMICIPNKLDGIQKSDNDAESPRKKWHKANFECIYGNIIADIHRILGETSLTKEQVNWIWERLVGWDIRGKLWAWFH